jgi:hypothetical protein
MVLEEEPSAQLLKLAGRYFKRWDTEDKVFVSNIKDEYPRAKMMASNDIYGLRSNDNNNTKPRHGRFSMVIQYTVQGDESIAGTAKALFLEGTSQRRKTFISSCMFSISHSTSISCPVFFAV